MNVKEIVEKFLKENNYDGLISDDSECACIIGELSPCGEMNEHCEPGYQGPCDCGDHDYHIWRTKEDAERARINEEL